jgi:peptidyl-prolyl cis-trans isomerase C
MQFNFRNCFLAIAVSFFVIGWGIQTQAEESTTTNKGATTTKSTTTKSTTTTKGATTDKSTTTDKSAATDKSATSTKGTTTTKSATSNKGKVASVNGTAISQEQFDRAWAPYKQQIDAQPKGTVSNEQLTQVKTRVLDTLIATELLTQESQKSGVAVNETEVNKAYDEQKAQFKTDAEFQAALKQYNFTEAGFKKQIKQQIGIQQFIVKKFAQNTTISDEEVKKYYDDNPDKFKQDAQVKVSHIMIMISSDADQAKKDEAKKKIGEALKRVKAGEDFAVVAKEVSEDTGSKDGGGDLDYLSKGQTPQAFEDAAFALKQGEISDIVETPNGFHIIKVTDKKDAKTITYDESKEEVRSALKSNKINSDINKYLAELKKTAKIETFLAK